jgi:hypothetical protein
MISTRATETVGVGALAASSAGSVGVAKEAGLKGVGVGVELGKGMGVAAGGASLTGSSVVGVREDRSKGPIVGVGVTLAGVQALKTKKSKIETIRLLIGCLRVELKGWTYDWAGIITPKSQKIPPRSLFYR